jgi:hypothetical protein
MSKVEEYKKKLEDWEQKQAKKVGKKFNPKQLLEDAREFKRVKHPELGEVVISVLTVTDYTELGKIEDNKERAVQMVWRSLKAGCPELTVDMVREFPMDATNELLKLVMAHSDFLPKKLRLSETGLAPAETPRR